MKSWIRRNRILAETFEGNFEGFLNLAIRETSHGRNAVGHFRSCHINAEVVGESQIEQDDHQDFEDDY